jgi:hypothetical protein
MSRPGYRPLLPGYRPPSRQPSGSCEEESFYAAAPAAEGVFRQGPGLASEGVFREGPGPREGPGVAAEGVFRQGPGIAGEGVFRQDPGFAYRGPREGPGIAAEGVFRQGPGIAPEGVFRQGPGIASNLGPAGWDPTSPSGGYVPFPPSGAGSRQMASTQVEPQLQERGGSPTARVVCHSHTTPRQLLTRALTTHAACTCTHTRAHAHTHVHTHTHAHTHTRAHAHRSPACSRRCTASERRSCARATSRPTTTAQTLALSRRCQA